MTTNTNHVTKINAQILQRCTEEHDPSNHNNNKRIQNLYKIRQFFKYIIQNLLLNQRVAILSPKNIRDSFYVYTMFRSESMKNELIHIARGTAQLNLSPIETGEKLTVIPPDSILEAFAKVGKGTFNQYISLKMENIRLMEIRDSLLPKLMSGELKINDLTC